MNSLGLNKTPQQTRECVAMSGGVDSTAAVILLKNQGYDVFGLTLDLLSPPYAPAAASIQDAATVAEKLGIECIVLNAEALAGQDADALGEGNGSVGTKLELEHTAPTPVGMTVTCESELVAVEGRKLTFKVALHDEKGPVGGGTHERFVINNAKFAAKAEAKKG